MTEAKITTDQTLEQLEIACQELETTDELRTAELRNILTIVKLIRKQFNDGLIDDSEIDIELDDVIQRLNFLAINPNHSGKHEKHRDTSVN